MKQGAARSSCGDRKIDRDGYRYAILDATEDAHLMILGEALQRFAADHRRFRHRAWFTRKFSPRRIACEECASGFAAALLAEWPPSSPAVARSRRSGKSPLCKRSHPTFKLDPIRLANGEDQVARALDFAKAKLAQGPVLIYASASPEEVKQAQQDLGKERASEIVESAQGKIAQGLVAAGVRKLVIAGGETSGAVVSALKIKALQIGPQIDPGVPWTMSMGETENRTGA